MRLQRLHRLAAWQRCPLRLQQQMMEPLVQTQNAQGRCQLPLMPPRQRRQPLQWSWLPMQERQRPFQHPLECRNSESQCLRQEPSRQRLRLQRREPAAARRLHHPLVVQLLGRIQASLGRCQRRLLFHLSHCEPRQRQQRRQLTMQRRQTQLQLRAPGRRQCDLQRLQQPGKIH